jgi:hypothetical protein
MIEFNYNGIAIPTSWDRAYAYVAKCQNQLAKEWGEKLEKTGKTPEIEKDPRDMYILERSDSLEFRWHHAGSGNTQAPRGTWRPICVIQEGSYAHNYMHGFVDAIEAVEVVLWNWKKRVAAEQVEKMVKHLVKMERI